MLQKDYKHELRDRLNEGLVNKGHTISSLAREINVDKSTISKMLSDKYEFNPTIDTFLKVATALDISFADILEQRVRDRKRS